MKEITIYYDDDCDMLNIVLNLSSKDNISIFEGNVLDFDRSPHVFKRLFDNLGFNTKLEQKSYEDWYDE